MTENQPRPEREGLRPADAGAALTAEALKDVLHDKISRIEMPKQIEFRAELPKTAVGNLSNKELIAESLNKSGR